MTTATTPRATTGAPARRQVADRLFRGGSGLAAYGGRRDPRPAGGDADAERRQALTRRSGLGVRHRHDLGSGAKDIYGALPYIVGTLASAAIALVIATPIALLTAIYLAELAPRGSRSR